MPLIKFPKINIQTNTHTLWNSKSISFYRNFNRLIPIFILLLHETYRFWPFPTPLLHKQTFLFTRKFYASEINISLSRMNQNSLQFNSRHHIMQMPNIKAVWHGILINYQHKILWSVTKNKYPEWEINRRICHNRNRDPFSN